MTPETGPGPQAAGPQAAGPVTGRPPVIGLAREREVLTVALQAARHVVLEGPPGTGKSTLLRSIARDLGQAIVFAEGNAELTPARLVGQYDPAQVLADGYLPSSFTDGPLLQAMRGGALLYLEEFNRVPEETLNVLITVLAEGEIAVPRLGLIRADPGFRLIAAMNPFDAVGTARVSQAIADRICRVVLGYQDAGAERAIVRAVAGRDGPVVPFAVALTRSTREHRDVRMGSSVRGAIDLVLLIDGLTHLRSEPAMSLTTARDAAYAALSGRIRIADGCDRTPEAVIDDLLELLWPRDAAEPDLPEEREQPDGQGKANGPPPPAAGLSQPAPSRSSLRRERGQGPARRSPSRSDLSRRYQHFAQVSPAPGELDQEALAAVLAEDPDLGAALLADLSQSADETLRAAARRIAARIFVQLGAAGGPPARGMRRVRSVPRGDGDLDLDRTLDRLDGAWPPRPDDLITRSWQAQPRSVCLLVDASGSMSGLGLAMAAVATAGVLLTADGHAAAGRQVAAGAAAFAGTVTVLRRPGHRQPAEVTVGRLLGLRGHGLTDISAALRSAAVLLSEASGDRQVILLSDGLATAGGDPADALAGTGRLDVLCPVPPGRPAEAEALAAAARLARLGGGISQPVRTLADIPAALSRVLTVR